MLTRTHTLQLAAPKDRAFAFLAAIDNLPEWATGFCRQLKLVEGKHKVVTPEGEIFFRIEADPASGLIDMYGGPSEDRMAHWPARIVATPEGGSLLIFTAFQYPGVSEEKFAAQFTALAHEFELVRRLTEAA